jgi:hypothetical protein
MIGLKQILILLIISIMNVGCFEVLEEINLNEDGSGEFKFTVNFSQSAPTINTLMSTDEVEGHKVPTQDKIDHEFYELTDLTKTVNGISNVHSSSDFDDYIFVYSCEFNSCENLNNLVDTIKAHHKQTESLGETYFDFDGELKIFERKGDDLLKKAYEKMKDSQRMIFNNAVYTSVYRFKTEVNEINNSNVKLSPSKRAVMHKLDMLKLIYNQELINKTIKLK